MMFEYPAWACLHGEPVWKLQLPAPLIHLKNMSQCGKFPRNGEKSKNFPVCKGNLPVLSCTGNIPGGFLDSVLKYLKYYCLFMKY